MDSKKLADAVRNLKAKVDEITDEDVFESSSENYDALNDAKDLLGVLAHIIDGKSVAQAFGSPGDWGYGTPIGDALRSASIFSNVKNPPRPEGDNPVA